MSARIALLGFSIECNRFAPVATEQDFVTRSLFRGAAMLAEARAEAPHMLGELPGFVADKTPNNSIEIDPLSGKQFFQFVYIN